MSDARRWGVTLLLLSALAGCGDDSKANDDNTQDETGGDGDTAGDGDSKGDGDSNRISACKAATAEQVSELADVTVTAEQMGSGSTSNCFYEGVDPSTISITLSIQYNGASSFEASRQGIEDAFGPTQDLSGIGEAAFMHFAMLDVGDSSANSLTLTVKQGSDLIIAGVGDLDLSEERALGLAKRLANLGLSSLE